MVNERVQRGLDAFFASVGKLAWEVIEEDVAAWQERLVEAGLAVSTRRAYLGHIRTFYDYLRDHPHVPLSPDELQTGAQPTALQVKYGREVTQPVSPWVSAAYSTDDATTERYLPTREELRGFFGWLRRRVETARKPMPLARDYSLYRLLYHSGLRANELVHLAVRDMRLETLVIHVRAGKGTNGSARCCCPNVHGKRVMSRIGERKAERTSSLRQTESAFCGTLDLGVHAGLASEEDKEHFPSHCEFSGEENAPPRAKK